MKIKLDENLPVRIKAILQTRGHDVDTVPEEQLSGCPDASEVSGWARCFVVVTDHKIRVRRPDDPA